MTRFSIRNPYFIVVVCLLLTVIGVTSLARMPIDLFPTINLPEVVVATFYSGMPPEDIETDITDPQAMLTFGHGVPVMVQTMTRTMPGWNRWNATHMITIFAFDFSHDDPALDTVTYAETPSPLAGYRGPDFQTITVKALWVAMQAYLREFPQDPMNVIS